MDFLVWNWLHVPGKPRKFNIAAKCFVFEGPTGYFRLVLQNLDGRNEWHPSRNSLAIAITSISDRSWDVYFPLNCAILPLHRDDEGGRRRRDGRCGDEGKGGMPLPPPPIVKIGVSYSSPPSAAAASARTCSTCSSSGSRNCGEGMENSNASSGGGKCGGGGAACSSGCGERIISRRRRE